MALTPRIDMDRAQMLSLIMGDAFHSFPSANPLFLKNRTLVSSCDGTPAQLQISPIGNPLDAPLTVAITSRTAGVALKDARFADKTCATPGDPERCDLARGVRIAFANFSNVGTTWGCDEKCRTLPPL